MKCAGICLALLVLATSCFCFVRIILCSWLHTYTAGIFFEFVEGHGHCCILLIVLLIAVLLTKRELKRLHSSRMSMEEALLVCYPSNHRQRQQQGHCQVPRETDEARLAVELLDVVAVGKRH